LILMDPLDSGLQAGCTRLPRRSISMRWQNATR